MPVIAPRPVSASVLAAALLKKADQDELVGLAKDAYDAIVDKAERSDVLTLAQVTRDTLNTKAERADLLLFAQSVEEDFSKIILSDGDVSEATFLETSDAFARTIAAFASMLPLDASAYGVVADGTTDNGPALRKCLAIARTRRNKQILLPAGIICVGSTITCLDWCNIELIGQGIGVSAGAVPPNLVPLQDGTIIKWIGPAGGTILDWQSPNSPARAYMTANSKIRGIVLDGNGTADKGLLIRGLLTSHLGIKFRNVRAVGVDLDVYPGGSDCQHNFFEYIEGDLDYDASMTAKGLVIGPGNSYNNVHHNLFQLISINTRNGTGFEVGNSDSNNFASIQINYPYQQGGNIYNGKGMVLMGAPNAIGPGGVTQACRSNNFFSVSNPAGTYAMAGSFGLPSYGNWIFGYIQDSGEPEPVIETGATLFWFNSFGIQHNASRFETMGGAYLLGGENAPRTGVAFPMAKGFASIAEFGADRPLYALGPNPGLGYNMYYSNGTYRFGPGSNNHFGGVANFDTSAGRLSYSFGINPGAAGGPVGDLREVFAVGLNGNKLCPVLSSPPSNPVDYQSYTDSSLGVSRTWLNGRWNNWW